MNHMNLNIKLYSNNISNIQEAATNLIQDLNSGKYSNLTKKINRSFFLHIENIWCQNDVKFNKTIKDETEYRKFKSIEIEADSSIPVWGILEGIPAIGSILSFVSVIWCQIAKMVITRQLKAIIKEPNEGSEDQKTLYAVKILEKATAYTQYQNKQNGSALGLIPLLKPIARVTQLVCLLKRAGVEHQDSNNF